MSPLRIRTTAGRLATYTTLASFVFALCGLFLALRYVERQVEEAIVAEARENARHLANFALSYFFWNDNLIHLQSQQRYLNSRPNILYSYLIGSEGIVLGIDGIDSSDKGLQQQSWEPELARFSDESATFRPSQEVSARVGRAIDVEKEITLLNIPMDCRPGESCASVRVAIQPVTHLSLMSDLRMLGALSVAFVALCIGLISFILTRRGVKPISDLTRDLELLTLPNSSKQLRDSSTAVSDHDTVEVARLKQGLKAFSEASVKAAKSEAVAQMTSMIAHDVRKPFTQFKLLANTLAGIETVGEFKTFVREVLPEIDQAVVDVNDLLADVMQVNAEKVVLVKEEIDTVELIDKCLRHVFRAGQQASFEIETVVDGCHVLAVDELKVRRVFENILTNACQAAANVGGKIWINAVSKNGRAFFTVGNSGSYVSKSHCELIFESFFTSDKKGGTGLGLAIAKKWVLAHGGGITCRSVKEQELSDCTVEFQFDLPLGRGNTAGNISRSCRSSAQLLKHVLAASSAEYVVPEEEMQGLREALAGQVLKVVAVDDEPLYLSGFQAAIDSLNLGSIVVLAKSGFVSELGKLSADVYFVDYDLGEVSLDGLDLVSEYKRQGGAGFVCLHTNRAKSEVAERAQLANVDHICSKPISPLQLVKVLTLAARHVQRSRSKGEGSSGPRLKVAVLDDSAIVRLSWKRAMGTSIELSLYSSPHEFFSQPIDRFDVVVTDLNFGSGQETGEFVARRLRESYPSIPILVCSEADFPNQSGLFTACLGKAQLPNEQLLLDVLRNCGVFRF